VKVFRQVAVVVTAAALAFGCVSGDQKPGTRHFNIVALEDEWQLGAQLSADIARRVQLGNDPQSLTYLRGIGERLVRQTRLANVPWEFHIISSPDVNVFAAPGGHIYVTTAAIKSMRSASELAGLVAHVLGNAVDRQTTVALSIQYGRKHLARIAGGSDRPAYDEILSQVLSGGTIMRFTAEDEHAADESTAKWLHGAGYDPSGLVSMIQGLQAQSGNASVQRFLAAHPIAGDTISNIQTQISKLPKKNGLITDEPEFQAVKARS
jgi:predicted Zn-dependent protease